jgi:sarcosine oxidase subunit beta
MDSRAVEADVLVLGGGLTGCAIAFHLTALKAGKVVLLERDQPGTGATGSSAGILTYQGWNRWDVRLVRESAEEYRTISEKLGCADFRENGGLRVVRTEEGVRWLERIRQTLGSEGVETRALVASEVQGLFPQGDFEDVRMGIHTPADALFDPVEMEAAYAHLAERDGAELRCGRGAPRIARSDGFWEVRDGADTLRSKHLVLACGAWTKRLISHLGHPLPLAPFRTQACVLRPHPLAATFPTFHDTDLNLYMRPAMMGRVLVGNGTGPNEVDPEFANPGADPNFVERITAQLGPIIPAWPVLRPEASWAGVCVASPDSYPLVGHIPNTEGLYVASGFNGFGTMRAAALARLLAEGIVDGRWEPLEPADPARFHDVAAPFAPRPEFSIRDDCSSSLHEEPPSALRPMAVSIPLADPPVSYKTIQSLDEINRLTLPSLSFWFDPFLKLFMKDAVRCAGEVQVADVEGEIRGVYLFSPVENTVSIFTRTRRIAEHFLSIRNGGEVYLERDWEKGAGRIRIMLANLNDWDSDRHFRNPVRVAEDRDLPQVQTLFGELQGVVDMAWFRTLPRPEEKCFVSEIDGRIVGASWLTIMDGFGRGHSLLVHPRYRKLGIATDLLLARMLWLKGHGIRHAVSEIYEDNGAAQMAAERAGMTRVGNMFVYHRS